MGISLGFGRVDDDDDTLDPTAQAAVDAGLEPPPLDPDPRPKRGNKGQAKPLSAVPPRVTAKIRAEVKDTVALLCDVPALGLARSHEGCCLPVYNETSGQIHERITAIICRRPAAVAFFTGGGDIMEILALAMALKPLVTTYFHNHMGAGAQLPDDGSGGVYDLSNYQAPRFAP